MDPGCTVEDFQYATGAQVVVEGLVAAAFLNGILGVIVGHQGNRCMVDLPMHGEKALKEANLRAAHESDLKPNDIKRPQEFKCGSRVSVHGLTGATDLNGLFGTFLGCEGDRHKVWLPEVGTKAIKEEHLSIEPFPPRTRVMVHSLTNAADLNGEVGIVTCSKGERYEVNLGQLGWKALHPWNLRIATPRQVLLPRANIGVVAPGAGTTANADFYTALKQNPDFDVSFIGQSRAFYDRYPVGWPGGSAAPNLESFAEESVGKCLLESKDCIMLGSRGGQVVLPVFWKLLGPEVPPAIVVNGGCAMHGANFKYWPENAVSFLMLGGEDTFRGKAPEDKYIRDTASHVPKGNASTAILFVREMTHMPQAALMRQIVPGIIAALLLWKAFPAAPVDNFSSMLNTLTQHGWSGHFRYTEGGQWIDFSFPCTPEQIRATLGNRREPHAC